MLSPFRSPVPMRRSFVPSAVLASIALLTTIAPLHAQSARTLGGHTFIPSSFVRSEPFISQYFRTQTGAGQAFGFKDELVLPGVDTTVVLEGDIAFLSLDGEYQHAFGNWLAVSLAGTGSARIGTDAQALFAQGVTGIYGASLGVTVRVLEGEKAMLSVGADLASSSITGVDILGFIREVIDEDVPVDSARLVRTVESSSTRISGLGAWAPKPWLGLTGYVGTGWSDVFSTDNRSDPLFTAGGLASLDLKPLTGTPIGFTAGGKYDSLVPRGEDIANKVWGLALGVAYTGRENFHLGLEYGFLRLPLRTFDADLTVNTIGFNLRYYWN
jgi:hypothetical protein